MRLIPSWLVKTTKAEDYDALLDWRLTPLDVARIMGVRVDRVGKWSTRGRRGHVLRSRRFTNQPRSARTYRLVDVEEFADNIRWGIDYTLLPVALQREWRVGIFLREDDKHDTLDTLTNREEHRDENRPRP